MRYLCTSLVVLTIAGTGLAADPKHQQAAQSFSFEGVSFNTTLEEFRKKYPDAKLDSKASNEKLGLQVFDNTKLKYCQLAEYSFVNDKLMSVKVYYLAQDFQKSGGFEVFMEKLLERFGKWDPDSPEMEEGKFKAFWNFPDANRYLELVMNDDRAIFFVVNTQVASELLKKRAENADFGF